MATGAVEVQTPYVADQSYLANTEVGFWGPDPFVTAGRSLMLKQPRGLVMASYPADGSVGPPRAYAGPGDCGIVARMAQSFRQTETCEVLSCSNGC
jgi:hypothetical protein